MNECLKTHPLLHTITGIGIGMLLLVLLPALWSQALLLGLAAFLAGLVGEVVFLGKSARSSKKRR